MLDSKNVSFRHINLLKESLIDKYIFRFVGSKNFGDLIKYEFVELIGSKISGGIGMLFRKLLYPWMFPGINRNTYIDSYITIRCPKKVFLSEGVILDKYVYLDIPTSYKQGLVIGRNSTIGNNTYISSGYEGYVIIGENTNIGSNSQIYGEGSGVKIGNDVLIAGQSFIVTVQHIFDDIEKPIFVQGSLCKKIIIKNNVWIGANVKILGGVTIEEGSIIGAGSVVTESIPPFSIVVGIPAKVVKIRKK
ncbi:MAG: acyltransferase [bacterium]